MLEDKVHLEDVPKRFWEKMGMAFGVLIFGMLIPYHLTVEADFHALMVAMGIGILPFFGLFIYLKHKNFWRFKAAGKEWVKYLKLFTWAVFVSSTLHTPLLLINRIVISPLDRIGVVKKIQTSFSRRTNIYPPHMVLWSSGERYSIRLERKQLERFEIDHEVHVQGEIGFLGYITYAEVD